jgi:hypothetical protein
MDPEDIQQRELRKLMLEVVTPEVFGRIVGKMVELAEAGNVEAWKELNHRLFGYAPADRMSLGCKWAMVAAEHKMRELRESDLIAVAQARNAVLQNRLVALVAVVALSELPVARAATEILIELQSEGL